MTVRLKRLQSDYEAVRRLAHVHPRIEVEGVQGNPPEKYRLVLRVRSLREKAGHVVVAKQHRLEVTLPRGYPRDAPICRMLTPVFHPNIAPHAVCIGDHWTAAESLDLMIQRVGEMLAFQSYNVKSPLNGKAAQWIEENVRRLPLEHEEFFVDVASAPEPADEAADGTCTNCGGDAPPLESCAEGHLLCADCAEHCSCGRLLCLACGTTKCEVCHGGACANCGSRAGAGEGRPCDRGHFLCADCVMECERCGRTLCLLCGEYPCRVCRTVTTA